MMPPRQCPHFGSAPPAGIMTLGAGAWCVASARAHISVFDWKRGVIGGVSFACVCVRVGVVRLCCGYGGGSQKPQLCCSRPVLPYSRTERGGSTLGRKDSLRLPRRSGAQIISTPTPAPGPWGLLSLRRRERSSRAARPLGAAFPLFPSPCPFCLVLLSSAPRPPQSPKEQYDKFWESTEGKALYRRTSPLRAMVAVVVLGFVAQTGRQPVVDFMEHAETMAQGMSSPQILFMTRYCPCQPTGSAGALLLPRVH